MNPRYSMMAAAAAAAAGKKQDEESQERVETLPLPGKEEEIITQPS